MWGQGVMFPVLVPHLITGYKFMNLFPKEEWHPFWYKLSYLLYYLTQLFHLLWNPIPPYLWQIFPTPILLWEGASHRQFHKENNHGNVGLPLIWVRLLEASPSMKNQSLWSILKVSLKEFSCLSTILELWGLYAVSHFHLIFRALHTCWIKSATKAGLLSDPILVGNLILGIISQSRQRATSFAFSVWVAKASTHPEKVHTMTS